MTEHVADPQPGAGAALAQAAAGRLDATIGRTFALHDAAGARAAIEARATIGNTLLLA